MVCGAQNAGKTLTLNRLYRAGLDARELLLSVNRRGRAWRRARLQPACPQPRGRRVNGWSVDLPTPDRTGNRLGEMVFRDRLSLTPKYLLALRPGQPLRVVGSCE